MNSLLCVHNHIKAATTSAVASPYLFAFDFNQEDISGNYLLNKATGTYDCTLANTACIQSAVTKFGTGALLEDGSQLATINVAIYPDLTLGFTFACNFNISVTGSNMNYLFSMGGGTRCCIRVGYNTTYGGNCIYYQLGSSQTRVLNSTIAAIMPTFWQSGTWYHICWTIDPGGSVHKMYIDGILISTATYTMSFNQTFPAGSGIIGCNTGQSNGVFYVDNFRLWNKTATQTEVTAFKNGTL
jgi:hypothetical protein